MLISTSWQRSAWLEHSDAVWEIAGSIPAAPRPFCKKRRIFHDNLIVLAVRGLAGIVNDLNYRIHQGLAQDASRKPPFVDVTAAI